MAGKTFLFLQGPISPFFPRIADALEARGHAIRRINLNLGDRLFWTRKDGVDYRGRPKAWPDFITTFLDREGVTDIVMLGEQRAYHKVAIRAAKERGIRVVVTDFGYLRPDWITLEAEGMNGASLFPKDPAAIRAIAAQAPEPDLSRRFYDSFPTMARWDMRYHLSQIFWRWPFRHYETHQLHDPSLIYLGTGRRMAARRLNTARAERAFGRLQRENTPYYLLPLQMETDFQLRAYSPYPDLSTPVREIVRSFARHAPAGTKLLVKNHPLDPGLRNWRWRVARIAREEGVANRVLYVDGGDLDAMILGARGTVMVNSTVGLRALMLGKPVKILGEAIYNVPGMVTDQPLDAYWQAPKPPDLGLVADFVRALAATVQLRGVFYSDPGLQEAVDAAVERLDKGLINVVIPADLAEAS